MSHEWNILRKPESIIFLRELNRILFDMELAVKHETERQKSDLMARLRDSNEPFLSDFEIEVEFQFFLSEDYPGYGVVA